MTKAKRKIIYSALLFMVALIALLALTLSWFVSEPKKISDVDLYYPGTRFDLYHTEDLDGDGLPDELDGDLIYILDNRSRLEFKYFYPNYSMNFRIEISPPEEKRYISFTFNGMSEPEAPDNGDVAKALRIRYINPVNGLNIDSSLYDMISSGRNAVIFSDLETVSGDLITFDYEIYMDPAADNSYQQKVLSIDSVSISVTQS